MMMNTPARSRAAVGKINKQKFIGTVWLDGVSQLSILSDFNSLELRQQYNIKIGYDMKVRYNTIRK